MPRKTDLERPVKIVDGVRVLILPETVEAKKGRHRHIRNGTPKKERGRPKDGPNDI